MKRFIIPMTLLLTSTLSSPAGWFTSNKPQETAAEREKRIQVEAQLGAAQTQLSAAQTQLHQEHQTSSHWQTISMALAVACPILLIVGATLGVAARRRNGQQS